MAHYVNNAEMLEAIKTYKTRLKDARDNGTNEPRIPEYLGKCVLMIANRLSYKSNFIIVRKCYFKFISCRKSN